MLELCNVNMLFRQKKIKINVLKNINLVLPNTGLVIIKGPSGVGKTTLLNIISGLKKPSKGYIKYNCKKIKNMTEFRRNHIFYAMQNDSLYKMIHYIMILLLKKILKFYVMMKNRLMIFLRLMLLRMN